MSKKDNISIITIDKHINNNIYNYNISWDIEIDSKEDIPKFNSILNQETDKYMNSFKRALKKKLGIEIKIIKR